MVTNPFVAASRLLISFARCAPRRDKFSPAQNHKSLFRGTDAVQVKISDEKGIGGDDPVEQDAEFVLRS